MSESIFQRLLVRVERRDFKVFKVGQLGKMYGMELNKNDWEEFYNEISPPGVGIKKPKIMWFRGIPLKKK